MRRAFVILLVLVALCAPSAVALGRPRLGAAQTDRVKMADRYRNVFRPGTVRIERGDAVRWVNVGDITHTATGEGWDSGAVSPGGSYERRFRARGTYRYRCVLHPEMTGAIIVG